MSAVAVRAPATTGLNATCADFATGGIVALSLSLTLTGLARAALLGSGRFSHLAVIGASLLQISAFALMIIGAATALALRRAVPTLALGGATLLTFVALVMKVVKADALGWGQLEVAATIALAALVAASTDRSMTRAVGVALRVPIYTSLAILVATPASGRSPLADRYGIVESGYRFRGVFNHPVALSSACLLLFGLVVTRTGNRFRRIAECAVAVVLVLATDTRSGILGMLVLLIARALFVSLARRRGVRAVRGLIAVAVGGLFAAQTFLSLWAAERWQALLDTTSWRSLIWHWCWSSIAKHPLTGGDTSVFAGGSNPQVLWWHCHNETLTTLYSLGLPGLAALALLLVGLAACALRDAGHGNATAFVSLLAVLWLGLFETPLGYSADPQTLLIATVAILAVAGSAIRPSLDGGSARDGAV